MSSSLATPRSRAIARRSAGEVSSPPTHVTRSVRAAGSSCGVFLNDSWRRSQAAFAASASARLNTPSTTTNRSRRSAARWSLVVTSAPPLASAGLSRRATSMAGPAITRHAQPTPAAGQAHRAARRAAAICLVLQQCGCSAQCSGIVQHYLGCRCRSMQRLLRLIAACASLEPQPDNFSSIAAHVFAASLWLCAACSCWVLLAPNLRLERLRDTLLSFGAVPRWYSATQAFWRRASAALKKCSFPCLLLQPH